MNAITEDENGEYLDPHGGIDDIERKLIRCVGSVDKLREDGLRILRALRFSITLGFRLDDSIEEFLHTDECVGILSKINKDRTNQEVSKMFKYDTLKSLDIFYKYPNIKDYIFTNIKLKSIV